jgi:RNA polymerase sigma-70 factor (ECF subfamily)
MKTPIRNPFTGHVGSGFPAGRSPSPAAFRPNEDHPFGSPGMGQFQTTRWSLIATAARESPSLAREALEQLCRAYRPPVVAYLRRDGHAPADAEDLAQAFFVRFIERGWYRDADPERGRFRSLLLTALRRFALDHAQSEHAARRDASRTTTLDDADTDPAGDDTPERAFTRAWMGTVLDNAWSRLQDEWARAGKRELFARLAPLLLERAESAELHALAAELGLRPNTLSVQAHRVRQRLRQLVRLELLQTVGDHEALEQELAELRGAMPEAP